MMFKSAITTLVAVASIVESVAAFPTFSLPFSKSSEKAVRASPGYGAQSSWWFANIARNGQVAFGSANYQI